MIKMSFKIHCMLSGKVEESEIAMQQFSDQSREFGYHEFHEIWQVGTDRSKDLTTSTPCSISYIVSKTFVTWNTQRFVRKLIFHKGKTLTMLISYLSNE